MSERERKERKSNDEMVVSSKLNRCLISIDQADKIAVQNKKRTNKSKKQRDRERRGRAGEQKRRGKKKLRKLVEE